MQFEQQGARRRSNDFRRGERVGACDHLLELRKPVRKPDWITDAQYAKAPETLILVTTLLCPKQTHKADLKGALSRTLARRARLFPHQDHAGHREAELQNTIDGAKVNLGLSAIRVSGLTVVVRTSN